MSESLIFYTNVEGLCSIIDRTNPEFWDERNKAILNLTILVKRFESYESPRIQEIFTADALRLMRDPIKSMISDLRSQQVRDTCNFLGTLSRVCGDQLKPLMREIFPTILEIVKIPNKVFRFI